MRIIRVLSVSVLLLATGCATSYQLSNNAHLLRSKMSREDALSIFHAQISTNKEKDGLCGIGYPIGEQVTPGTRPSKLVSMKDELFYFTGKYSKPLGSRSSGSMQYGTFQTTVDYEISTVTYAMDVGKIRYIAIEENKEVEYKGEMVRYYTACPIGTLVLLYTGDAPSPWIHVAPDKLDSFMAALSVLSPNATLRLGSGGLTW